MKSYQTFLVTGPIAVRWKPGSVGPLTTVGPPETQNSSPVGREAIWKLGCPVGPVWWKSKTTPQFQTAPEGKTVKNRVHWDVRLDGKDKDEARQALEARGATYLWSASQGPHSWHTMADPEGNEFCIS